MNREDFNKFLVKDDAIIVDAMRQIDVTAKGIVYVIDEKEKLLGSLTDGDVRRWIIKTGDLKALAKDIMNKAPKTLYRQEAEQAQEIMRKFELNSIPIVTRRGKITDIIFRKQSESDESVEKKGNLKDVPVIIMAGGKGTRLYPYTKILPKPLIPIGDIPIMERIIGKFMDYGVDNYYVTVNYKKNMIKSYFSDLNISYNVTYVEEDKPLGTAGSIRLIEDKFDRPVIVTNCDILINADYSDIYKYHKEAGNALTIVSALKNIIVPYGVINTKENGNVMSMDEKPKLSYFVNTGMYILSPEIIEYIPDDTFYHMTHLTDYLLEHNMTVGMYPISEDSFLDMGEFEEMNRMETKLNLKME